MVDKKFLTIGKLSEASGVHVKALRYYDRIGVLPPAYVNPENGYRYYSESHIYLVEMIRLCAELSIPLKKLKDFMTADGEIVDVEQIIDEGIRMVETKIELYQKHRLFLADLKNEMQRGETLKKGLQELTLTLEATDYWLEPFDGALGSEEFHRGLTKLIKKVFSLGLDVIYEMGTLYLFREGAYQSYLFLTLTPNEKNAQHPEVLQLPKTTYLTKLTNHAKIDEAVKDYPALTENEPPIFFELDILTGKSGLGANLFELRKSL
ncbi:MerR family transcriptional regulator [Enterococcus alishanensis]